MGQVRSHYVSSPRSPPERSGAPGTRSAEFGVDLPPSRTASRAVVLLCGPGGTSQEAVRLELALRDHGFDAATLSSEKLQDRTPTSFRHWISDGLAEIDRQTITHEEVNLCGISYGAALALAVAAERPTKLDGLALISPRLSPNVRTLAGSRSYVPMLKRLKDWRESVSYRIRPSRREAGNDPPTPGGRERSSPTADVALSSAQLRELSYLIRYVDSSLGRVYTPTLIIHAREDAAMVTAVRHLQVHIGSQFLEVLLESHKPSTVHEDSERTALKVVEFFNDVARRRALFAISRS
jgi:pimeloyl-ACP methyl ester carboxylesterase